MRSIEDADALANKLRHMGYMDESEEVQEVIDRFVEECDGDLISRQAAIDEVVAWLIDRMSDGKNGKPLTDRLKDLPSAQSERKNWKWIRESLVTDYPYKCSACKKYSRAMYDFCPNCGAKMKGE